MEINGNLLYVNTLLKEITERPERRQSCCVGNKRMQHCLMEMKIIIDFHRHPKSQSEKKR